MTAKEIILSLEKRFNKDKWSGKNALYHVQLEGTRGGDFTVTVDDKGCFVQEGLHGQADCVVKSSDKSYEEIEKGELKPQWALFTGKLKISNIPLMLEFTQMFDRLKA